MKTTATALCCALTLLLGGCGDDDPAPAPAPTSAAPSTSAATGDPGPLEPTLPAAATRDGKAGAEAFVEHYWAMVDYAQATGDLEGLEALQADYCDFCTGGVDGLRQVFEAGGRFVGGQHLVQRIDAQPTFRRMHIWNVFARLRTTEEKVRGAGRHNTTSEPSTILATHTVQFDDGQWLMSDVSGRTT